MLLLQLKHIKQFLVWCGIFARGELHITCLVCWESLLFHGVCICIKSSPKSPEDMLGCACCPFQLSCPGISCSSRGFVSAPVLVLCAWISWDLVMDVENRMESGNCSSYCICVLHTGCCVSYMQLSVLVLSESSKWDFSTAGSRGYLLSLWGGEWLVELNFVPAPPSFIKHLMMTELAIKSRLFQPLEGNVLQWLYLDCFQPRG